MQYKLLFSPLQLGNITLKNRIIAGPATMCYATENGEITDRLIEFYRKKAAGGVAMVIVEGAYISEESKGYAGQISIADDSKITGLSKMAHAIQAGGAKASIQIQHCGRRAKSTLTGLKAIAPSAIPYNKNAETPLEMTEEQIWEVIQEFADAAERAKKAGFNSVDIHSAHGYLPAAFMSPLANIRTDTWGGNLKNRTRFVCKVIKAMRERVGKDYPITIKISADEYINGGLTIKDTAEIVKILETAGISAIQVSAGAPGEDNVIDPQKRVTFMRTMPMATAFGPLVYLAEEVKKNVSIPVVAIGRLNDPSLAEEVLEKGSADIIGITRQLITDPEWPIKVFENRLTDIRPCIACNEGCYNMILSGGQPGCACNPEAGQEYLYIKKTETPVQKVVVVGGGTAGLQAALTASEQNHQVILLEKNDHLGGQLWLAQAPPDRQEISKIAEYMIRKIKNSNVDVRLNTEATEELLLAFEPNVIIVASGSVPVLPQKLCEEADFYTAHEVLEKSLSFPDKTAIIIGGGLVGCETADYLAQRQSKVTVVEMLPKIAGDTCEDERVFFDLKFKEHGVTVLTSTKVESIKGRVVTLQTPKGETSTEFGAVVLAIGSRANKTIPGLKLEDMPSSIILGQKEVRVLYAGDCLKARKIHDAFREGYDVAHNI